MKDQLAKALQDLDLEGDGLSSERILRAAFFRRAPLQAGTKPVAEGRVVRLDERRERGASAARSR